MKRSKSSRNLYQAIGILFLPVIVLYLVAYYFLGKRCTYRWGNFDITPLEPVTRNEYLFMRLFPALVALVSLGLVAGVTYLFNILVN